MNNTNNMSARQSYDQAQRMFVRAFRDKFNSDQATQEYVNTLKLSQGEYRFEVLLNGINNTFNFGITQNQPNSNNLVFNTENRLALQDSICVNEYGIFVGFPASTTATNWLLNTYGNTQIFTGAGVPAVLDSTFYNNGSLQIKCNNDVLVPYRGLFNHFYRAQTQQTAALGAASPGDQIRGAEDGMITAEPNIVLIGSKNYQVTINLPSAMSQGTFTTERAIMIVRGIVAQNSTVVS